MVFVMDWYFDLVFADIGFPLASVGDFVMKEMSVLSQLK
jgi:hypothetical protein